METHELINCVREWGIAKGLIGPEGKATERGQLYKLMEEVGELKHAILTNDKGEKVDAIGDCTVVLILLSEIIGISFEECLGTAYDVISKRTGKMVNGQFVKDNN
jgi:NTP pyrophosphatase (non-canonical NTP hydrolase)